MAGVKIEKVESKSFTESRIEVFSVTRLERRSSAQDFSSMIDSPTPSPPPPPDVRLWQNSKRRSSLLDH
jgi:hypothetical protein